MNAWIAAADPRYPGVWDTLSPYLDRAVKHDPALDWDMESLLAGLGQGYLRLYALVNDEGIFGAGISVDTIYPTRRVLTILAMGADEGHEVEWRQCFEQFCNLARVQGYAAISASGRTGWTRKLPVTRTRTIWEIDL